LSVFGHNPLIYAVFMGFSQGYKFCNTRARTDACLSASPCATGMGWSFFHGNSFLGEASA